MKKNTINPKWNAEVNFTNLDSTSIDDNGVEIQILHLGKVHLSPSLSVSLFLSLCLSLSISISLSPLSFSLFQSVSSLSLLIATKICSFAIDIICHNWLKCNALIRKFKKSWGRLEHPSVHLTKT